MTTAVDRWRTIAIQALAAGLVAGTILIAYLALTVFPDHNPIYFFLWIPSVALGNAAGSGMSWAILGIVLHYVVSVGWAGGYAYLAVTDHSASHGFGNDVSPKQLAKRIEEVRAYNESAPLQLTPRSYAEVARFLDGLELVEPGLVQLHRWRAPTPEIGGDRELANYGAVARKP